jgi:opine dehydrogenase
MALNGHNVRIYDRWGGPLEPIKANGGIELVGDVEGVGSPAVLTSDMNEAITDADLIVIAAPAFSHDFIGHELAKLAEPDQIILFQPGALGSGVDLIRKFNQHNRTPCFIAETSTSLYTCRKQSSTKVYIGAIKQQVKVAAVPKSQISHCLSVLNSYFDDKYVAEDNALTIGLNNANPIYHVPPAILNFKTVEDSSQYPLHSLVSPRIAAVIDMLDQERLSLARALGVQSASFWTFLENAYGVTDGDFQSRIVQGYGRQGFPEPDSLNHRYFTEDIPFGMVPWSSLAREVGLTLPLIESFITLGSSLCDQDFVRSGRTTASLGLKGVGREGIRDAFIDGTVNGDDQ